MKLINEKETYDIIGASMEVYNTLGKGFSEIVYKDALEYEFIKRDILYQREKEYEIIYKEIILAHSYYADFVIKDKVILEVKAIESISSSHIKQTLNYLAASGLKTGLIVNFGENSLKHKRVIL